MINVATVAFSGSYSTADNLDAMRECMRSAAAKGADLVVFPEIALHGYRVAPDANPGVLAEIYQQAEPVPGGPHVTAVAELARQLGIRVVYGLHERSPGRVRSSTPWSSPARLGTSACTAKSISR